MKGDCIKGNGKEASRRGMAKVLASHSSSPDALGMLPNSFYQLTFYLLVSASFSLTLSTLDKTFQMTGPYTCAQRLSPGGTSCLFPFKVPRP